MKVAFFSDVHGNIEALHAMVSASADCEARFCAGDLVGYGDRPNEVIEWIRESGTTTVIGNHDLFALDELKYKAERDDIYRASWTKAELKPGNLEWLRTLPKSLSLDLDGRKINLTHASPWDVQTYLYPDSDHLQRAMPTDDSTLVVGHCHHAFVCPGPSGVIVNCGSAGFPRSGPAGAQFMVLDTTTGSWTFRVAQYDIATVANRLREAGWNSDVIQRLVDPTKR
ncbi:MAG: metallophosphoesterase family protein [Armatimonadetes bacterium]|nr:metallophosphoesterase family protein [Armatimonadota bacterium]